MELDAQFTFEPLPPLENPIQSPFPEIPGHLGPLAGLAGKWSGGGFNVIWRPDHRPGPNHFLELNLTSERLELTPISGPIPNRGLLQPDINMFGLTYLQQISDASRRSAGLHIEPGLWAVVPGTSDPDEVPTVARLASIPHGTAIVAQGTASTSGAAPDIPDISIKPFTINAPDSTSDFPEQDLSVPSKFRTSGPGLTGITQEMVDNPNSVLRSAIAGQRISATVTLRVATDDTPVPGGGTANTAFLKGTAHGPNADAVSVASTFWLETIEGDTAPSQLQYSQIVLLNFKGLNWPHVTVGTLRKEVGS
jgi:hypothetical protein